LDKACPEPCEQFHDFSTYGLIFGKGVNEMEAAKPERSIEAGVYQMEEQG
jgi:hypothetical protein